MAAQAGPTTTPLIIDMLERGHEFSFPQVLRLACAHLGPDALERNLIKVRPKLSLEFPAADVDTVEKTADGGLLITASFGGLYGVDSPLATFETEDLFDDEANDRSVVRDFLDIIHQRLYTLYATSWSKYRTLVRIVEEEDPAEMQRAWCLLGMGEKELAEYAPHSFPFLRYSGLFARLTRPVSALEAMLKDALGLERIEIIQCVRRVVPIPEEQQMRLDSGNNTLDVDAVLGPDVEDWMGKMIIKAGPLDWEQYNSLLPDAPLYNLMAMLVHLYLPHPLVLELELVLAEGEAPPFIMDDPLFRLDYTIFLFDDVMPETSVRFPLAAPLRENNLSIPDFDSPSEGEPGPRLVEYYKKELANLRDLAADFGREHPEMAPLVSGPMADPGVERVLEGIAFLCAILMMKLHDDLPEIIHEVMRNTQPRRLCPVPASTIIAFTPKQNCTETHIIPACSEVASIPKQGTSCRFITVYPVEIHPLALVDASYSKPPGRPAMITLHMELTGLQPTDWRPETVRLFLSGEYGHAADLYLLLTRWLRRIIIEPGDGGTRVVLDPSNLKPVGFESGKPLFSASASGAVSHHAVREFSILPEKFLFLDLTGWDSWRDRGEKGRFEVRFELERPPFPFEKVTTEDFTLFAAPAVNVFPHLARPILFTGEDAEYPVVPEEGKPEHFAVYSIEKVTGISDGSAESVVCAPNRSYADHNPSYHEMRSESLHGYDTSISVKLPHNKKKGVQLTISSLFVELLCTNGLLPESLRVGDIRKETDKSPGYATFTNCTPVTSPQFDTLGDNRLWRLFGMQFINLKLLTTESLRAALRLLYTSVCQDRHPAVRNERHIEGIQGLTIEAGDRIVRQVMKRGWNIRIILDLECYCSPGDRYLFGSLLDHFLRGFVSEAYFSRTIIEDCLGGVKYELPTKMGRRALV
jgi:type VI secretion system protein ImpG